MKKDYNVIQYRREGAVHNEQHTIIESMVCSNFEKTIVHMACSSTSAVRAFWPAASVAIIVLTSVEEC